MARTFLEALGSLIPGANSVNPEDTIGFDPPMPCQLASEVGTRAPTLDVVCETSVHSGLGRVPVGIARGWDEELGVPYESGQGQRETVFIMSGKKQLVPIRR
jgi:hypothetical protein